MKTKISTVKAKLMHELSAVRRFKMFVVNSKLVTIGDDLSTDWISETSEELSSCCLLNP